MDFKLSDKQNALQETAREILGRKFSTQLMREEDKSGKGLNRDVWNEACKQGWTGMIIPESLDGQGASLLDACIVLEEIGRAGVALPLVASSGLSAAILQRLPEGEQRDLGLRGIADGKIVSPALIDEQARNEWDHISLQAVFSGKACILSGKKIMVPFADSADLLLVSAITSEGDVIIAMVNPESDGVVITSHSSGSGIPVSSVQLDGVTVTSDQIVAKGDEAQQALHAGLQVGSVLATAEAIGLSETIKDITTKYVTNRVAFGQSIGAFQAVAHPCADMHISAETIRLLTHQAAWMIDNGKEANEEMLSTKALANELFERVANDAFCLHGAEGFYEACDVQLFMRRIRGFCQTMGETQESLERAAQVISL